MWVVGIEMLIVGGIVINGGVVLILCDVYLCNIEIIMFIDGCVVFK